METYASLGSRLNKRICVLIALLLIMGIIPALAGAATNLSVPVKPASNTLALKPIWNKTLTLKTTTLTVAIPASAQKVSPALKPLVSTPVIAGKKSYSITIPVKPTQTTTFKPIIKPLPYKPNPVTSGKKVAPTPTPTNQGGVMGILGGFFSSIKGLFSFGKPVPAVTPAAAAAPKLTLVSRTSRVLTLNNGTSYARSSRGTVFQMTGTGSSSIEKKPNGDTITVIPGTSLLKIEQAGGSIIVDSKGGIWQETDPSGWYYKRSQDGTLTATNPTTQNTIIIGKDGTIVREIDKNGAVIEYQQDVKIEHNPDGSTTNTYPDGTKITETKSPDANGNMVSSFTYEYPDGSIQTVDGVTETVTFTDKEGTTTISQTNGTTIVSTQDGWVTTTYKDGTIVEQYSDPEDGDLEWTSTTYPDGHKHTEFEGDGTLDEYWTDSNTRVMVSTNEDGTSSTTTQYIDQNAHSTFHTVWSNGNEEWKYPDGYRETHMADGTVIKEWGDGTKQTVNPDGSVDIQYPDGNTQHIPGGSEEAEPYVSSSEAPAPGEEPAAEPAEPEEPGGGGGEGEEGSCFPAGTLVATEGSFISISLVRTGDVLPGYNLVTRQVEMLTVTKTILTENQPLLLLEFGNGSVMSTPTQPFYASAWTRAKDLKAGNQVLCRDGHWEVLMKDPVSAGGADVYNLQVSPSHSYYVGTMQLLVHNKMDVYESGGDESGGGDEFDPRWWDEDEAD